jgi:hypothetical protein
MTLLISTVTPSACWLSQDTALSNLEHVADGKTFGVSENAADLWGDLLPAGTSSIAPPLGFNDKVVTIPRLSMVIGGVGSLLGLACWCGAVAGAIGAADIDGIDALRPDLWRNIDPKVKAASQLLVVHLGWSTVRERMIGYAYDSATDFRPALIRQGHTIHPMPSDDDAEWERIANLWTPAAQGQLVEEFHVKVAQAQHRTFKRGMYRQGAVVGGQVHTARIDRNGIHLSVMHQFPDYAEQVERVLAR